jgi:hypothetical protein
MEPRVVVVAIPAQQTEIDPARVHAWLAGQGVTVGAVSLRYVNGSDGSPPQRELLIQTDADVAPLFANWSAVPRSEMRAALVAYRNSTQTLLQAASPIPAAVHKQWVRDLNDLLRAGVAQFRDDG